MTLYDIEKINVHGGSLRCYIKNSRNAKITNRCKIILNDEKKKLSLSEFKKFNIKIYKSSKNFKDKLTKLKKKGTNIIGYVSPARVSTITNVAKINSNLIEYIIDDSPLKQNRFSQGCTLKFYQEK